MKICLLPAVLSAAVLSSSVFAHTLDSREVRFEGDLDYAQFCRAVINDDVSMLKRALHTKVGTLASDRRNVLKMLLDNKGMTCNGFDLVDFSIQKEAANVREYLSAQQ